MVRQGVSLVKDVVRVTWGQKVEGWPLGSQATQEGMVRTMLVGIEPGLHVGAVKAVQMETLKGSQEGLAKEQQVVETQTALAVAGFQTVGELEAEVQEALALLGVALDEGVTPEKGAAVQKGVAVVLG